MDADEFAFSCRTQKLRARTKTLRENSLKWRAYAVRFPPRLILQL